uniref:Uncharacterized protein n=1 Tax=Cyprinus carpio TaxID=7962 RepID=A0A8C1ZMB5_CYPCA
MLFGNNEKASVLVLIMETFRNEHAFQSGELEVGKGEQVTVTLPN